jgi:threonine aldolase
MAEAEVGDDVYGEDPTARRIEALAAERLGKEAALFFPTGTMANQAAIRLHASPGDEAVVEALGHTHDWELGGAAALSGVQLRAVAGEAGVIPPAALAPILARRPYHQSRVRLLILENSHNFAGGRVQPQDVVVETCELARGAGLRCHLDGARLFNAAVASGRRAGELAAPFDSVMISLSKGLSAPAGSLLAGTGSFIAEARRVRKMLGGGMRQVGVLAAAGIVALEEGVAGLAHDHARARELAAGLVATGKAQLPYGEVQTNIVVVDVGESGLGAAVFCDRAREVGVLCSASLSGAVRFGG